MNPRNIIIPLLNSLHFNNTLSGTAYLLDLGFLDFGLLVGFGGLPIQHLGSHLR
jgi:hypothetical protein